MLNTANIDAKEDHVFLLLECSRLPSGHGGPYGVTVAQIFLFTGENAYAMQQERRRWAQQFAEKHGPENLLSIEGAKLTVRDLLDEVGVMPFLAEHRLVFVEGLPAFTKEQCESLRQGIHPAVLLVFVDDPQRKSPGRRGVPKDLQRCVDDVKEFPLLTPKAMQQWMDGVARREGATLQSGAAALLIEYCGSEQAMLESELCKLALHVRGGHITPAEVEQLVLPSEEGVVWRITDRIAAGKNPAAAAEAKQFLERGGEPYALWAVLLGFVKNVATVVAAVQSGAASAGDVAARTGMSPYALRSLFPFARGIDTDRMRALLAKAAESDVALKTGELRATDEWPGELLALIDDIILSA